MSRMLEALKQIEARSAEPPARGDSAPPEELPSKQSPPPDETPQEYQQTEPMEVVRDEEPVEAALAQVDAAVAMVADSLTHVDEHAQAYAELADNILLQLPSDRPASVMFTSPGDGVGTTEMLVPLAAALLERTDGELLLIDGNLHKPDLAGRLGIQPDRGLADVLLGAASWRQVVLPTAVQGISLLPGVKFPTSGNRLPQRLHLQPLLEELAEDYRLVLIDASSLAYGEVAPMAGYCDGTYLVVRLGQTTGWAVRQAARVIKTCHGRLMGCIVLGG